jgi:hypothetical protein
MSHQVLGGLQQPLFQAQLVPGSRSYSFVHVNLSRQGVRSNHDVRSCAVKSIVCRRTGLSHPLVTGTLKPIRLIATSCSARLVCHLAFDTGGYAPTSQ